VSEFRRPIRGLALIAALACALIALTACGRKGPLDPPPTAAAPAEGAGTASGQQAAPPPAESAASQPPSKRPFLLDPLLN
jgi:predicted small lipoprotein YifL